MTTDSAGGRLRERRILYAVSAMGLGHVQRSLPLIRHLLREGAEVEVVSHGTALEALETELVSVAEPDSGGGGGAHRHPPGVTFRSLPDYPPLQRGRGFAHYLLYLKDLLAIRGIAKQEEAWLRSRHTEAPLDLVVADGRFGFVHPAIPCLLVSHQIRVLLPRLFGPFQFIADVVQLRLLRRYRRVLVPDLPDPEPALAGELAHNPVSERVPVEYIGPLSTLDDPAGGTEDREAGGGPHDSDLLFVMGGFIEEERRRFTAQVTRILRSHRHVRTIFMLGGGSWGHLLHEAPAGTRGESLALGPERRRLFAGAKLWVGRAGYTTLMDLRAAGASGVLVPTPGMTEQSYLARHLRRWQPALTSAALDPLVSELLRAFPEAVYVDARRWPEPLRSWTTDRSVGVFHGIVESLLPDGPTRDRVSGPTLLPI